MWPPPLPPTLNKHPASVGSLPQTTTPIMQADGPRKMKVSMGYFWNMFLPILTFFIFGSILLMILQWPDDTLEVAKQNIGNALRNNANGK